MLKIFFSFTGFDEFNRIDISVLSVISSQIQTIRNALMNKLTVFEFDGQEITLDAKMGIQTKFI